MPKVPQTNQPRTPQVAQSRDLFETPKYATRILIPFLASANNHKINSIWEPASGEGRIADELRFDGFDVYESDIKSSKTRNRDTHIYDFLSPISLSSRPFPNLVDAIVTNPPYSLKRQFYEKCKRYDIPFALLIPANYCGWIIQAIQDGCEKLSQHAGLITLHQMAGVELRVSRNSTPCG